MQEDFEKVKLLLTTATTDQPINSNLDSILMTDASRLFGIGFALLQPLPKEKWSFIQCGSASLSALSYSNKICYHRARVHGNSIGHTKVLILATRTPNV